MRATAGLAGIHSLHAELCAVAQLISDVSKGLAHVGGGTQIALGRTNQEAAIRLSIKPEATKAYLRGAMRSWERTPGSRPSSGPGRCGSSRSGR